MTFSMMLLKARSIGVRNFRDGASKFIRQHKPLVITDRGTPEGVYLPYADVLEIADILDELNDRELLKTIDGGRRAIRAGSKGILFPRSLKKHKKGIAS